MNKILLRGLMASCMLLFIIPLFPVASAAEAPVSTYINQVYNQNVNHGANPTYDIDDGTDKAYYCGKGDNDNPSYNGQPRGIVMTSTDGQTSWSKSTWGQNGESAAHAACWQVASGKWLQVAHGYYMGLYVGKMGGWTGGGYITTNSATHGTSAIYAAWSTNGGSHLGLIAQQTNGAGVVYYYSTNSGGSWSVGETIPGIGYSHSRAVSTPNGADIMYQSGGGIYYAHMPWGTDISIPPTFTNLEGAASQTNFDIEYIADTNEVVACYEKAGDAGIIAARAVGGLDGFIEEVTVVTGDYSSCAIEKPPSGAYIVAVGTSNKLFSSVDFNVWTEGNAPHTMESPSLAVDSIGTVHLIYRDTGAGGYVGRRATVVVEFVSDEVFTFPDDTAKQVISVRTSYSDPPQIYAMREGALNFAEAGTGQLFQLTDDLVLQRTYDKTTNNAVARTTVWPGDAHYPFTVTFDGKIPHGQVLKGGDNGVGEDGYGTAVLNSLLTHEAEYYDEFDLDIIKVEARTADKVFMLLEGQRLARLNPYSADKVFESSILGYGLDIDVNKGNLKYIVGVGSSGLAIYDFDGNIKATYGAQGNSVVANDNYIYVHAGSTVKKFTWDGTTLFYKEEYTGVPTFMNRGLIGSKDGDYLLGWTSSKVYLFNDTMGQVFESTTESGIKGADIDVTNKNIYAVMGTSPSLLKRYEVFADTTSFGNPNNVLPAQNPFTETTTTTDTSDPDALPANGGFTPIETGGFIDNQVQMLKNGWGVSEDSAKWLIGIVIMFFVAAFAASKFSGIAAAFIAIIGLLAGAGIGVALGTIPVWFLIAIVMVIVIIFSKVITSGSGEE